MLTIGEPGLPTFQTHWRLIDLNPDISYNLLFLYFLACKGMNILTSEFVDSLLFVFCQHMQRSTFFYHDLFEVPQIFFFSVLYFMSPKSRFFEVYMDIWRGCQDVVQILTSLLHFFLSNTTERVESQFSKSN